MTLLIGNAITAGMLISFTLLWLTIFAGIALFGWVGERLRQRRLDQAVKFGASGRRSKLKKAGMAALAAVMAGGLTVAAGGALGWKAVGFGVVAAAMVPMLAMAGFVAKSAWSSLLVARRWRRVQSRIAAAEEWMTDLEQSASFEELEDGIRTRYGEHVVTARVLEDGLVRVGITLPGLRALEGITTHRQPIDGASLCISELKLFGNTVARKLGGSRVDITVTGGEIVADVAGSKKDLPGLSKVMPILVHVAEELTSRLEEIPDALLSRVKAGGIDAAQAFRLLVERFPDHAHGTTAARLLKHSRDPVVTVLAARQLGDVPRLLHIARHGLAPEAAAAVEALAHADDVPAEELVQMIMASRGRADRWLLSASRLVKRLDEPHRTKGLAVLAKKSAYRGTLLARTCLEAMDPTSPWALRAARTVLKPEANPEALEAALDVLAGHGGAEDVAALQTFAELTPNPQLEMYAGLAIRSIADRQALVAQGSGHLSLSEMEAGGELALADGGELELVEEPPAHS